MPVPRPYSNVLNPNSWKFEEDQGKIVQKIADAFSARDLKSTVEDVDRLIPVPDYIVVPSRVLEGVSFLEFPYVEEARVSYYTILRRQSR
jgi:hypothetical protein